MPPDRAQCDRSKPAIILGRENGEESAGDGVSRASQSEFAKWRENSVDNKKLIERSHARRKFN